MSVIPPKEWRTCDICRKEAADFSLPMLGEGGHSGSVPRIWICPHCQPAFVAQYDRWLKKGVEYAD